MKISKVIDYDDGARIVFEGELDGEELDTVIRLGLTALVSMGQIVPQHLPEGTNELATPSPT